LFQNRYKSIVVEEDAYFKELVRYIHLNPLRAKMVESMTALDRYPWSGHSGILGHKAYCWHDTAFFEKGIAMGRQPAFVGGGLVRSAGGWSEVKVLRRIGAKEKGDERILGSGNFVSYVLSKADLVKK
jgi:putative transposase